MLYGCRRKTPLTTLRVEVLSLLDAYLHCGDSTSTNPIWNRLSELRRTGSLKLRLSKFASYSNPCRTECSADGNTYRSGEAVIGILPDLAYTSARSLSFPWLLPRPFIRTSTCTD